VTRVAWRRLRPSRNALLRLDAIGDALLAAFLLAASWDDLYGWLGLPAPKPPWYAQLLGVALIAIALVEWATAGKPGEREVSRMVAPANALAAAVLVAWLAVGETGADLHGEILLWTIAASLALEAWLHGLAWRR
jgi:hypothetical protein